MTFDEQLTHAFETLTQRLRGQIDQEVERRAAERPDVVVDGAAARLNDAVRAIDAARSLTGVLDALREGVRIASPGAEVWLMRGGRLHRWRSEEADGIASVAPRPGDGVPLTIAGEAVGVVVERRTTNDEATTNDEPSTTNVEFLTRYAARSLEALTAFKMARALTERPATPAAGEAQSGPDAEEDASARRYARLLVSEIKLYHEPAVVEGRRDRDLATRLGGEIARARVMYQQRVPPDVRARADHFHDELVRTLCNGDSSLLQIRSEH